jgi:hypothetical protein
MAYHLGKETYYKKGFKIRHYTREGFHFFLIYTFTLITRLKADIKVHEPRCIVVFSNVYGTDNLKGQHRNEWNINLLCPKTGDQYYWVECGVAMQLGGNRRDIIL